MNPDQKDRIAYKFTRLLKPQKPQKHLSNFLPVIIDFEYVLPVFNPYSDEQLKERWGLDGLPPEIVERAKKGPFRTFQMCCQGHVIHVKTDRPISTREFCNWILKNLLDWKIDLTQYKNGVAICSHWLLAEIQHFTDCKEVFKSWGSTLYGEVDFDKDDITDTWANYNPSEPDLELEYEGVKFSFIDTFTIFGMSLEKLTQSSPFPKHKDEDIGLDGKPWKHWRKNPDLWYARDQDGFWEYADNDVRSLEWCVLHWGDWLWRRWHIDIFRTKTFSGIGLRLFKSRIKEPTEPFEKVRTPGKTKIKIEYDQSKRNVRDIYLDAYAAGRRGVGERGLIQGSVYPYDVIKEYTTAAILQPLPGPHTEFLMDTLTDSSDLDIYEGAAEVSFEFPGSLDFPCLPVVDRAFKKMIFPRTGVSTCGLAEIRLAKRLGAKMHIKRSCAFKPTPEDINHPLRQMLEEVLGLANEFAAKGDKAGETFMKNIANGVIGKFVQQNKLEQEETWMEETREASETSWSPILACLILSRARSILGEFLTLGTPVYKHTDSIFSKTVIDLNAPIFQALKEPGSGLKLDPTFVKFWTPRNAAYIGVLESGKIKSARGGLSVEKEVFENIMMSKIGNPKAPNRTVFVSLKVASFKDRKNPLGHEIVTVRETEFEYDNKRKLLNPDANLWTESCKTRPWVSIVELLNSVEMPGDKKHRTMMEVYEQQEARAFGQIGPTKVISEKDLIEMRQWLKEGKTRYWIADRFRDRYSEGTVYRRLKESIGE